MCEPVVVHGTMPLRTMALSALIGLSSVQLIAQSERPSLREMARTQQGDFGINIQGCGPEPSLADVVTGADLIVEGVVRTRASYLTDDDRDIFTDYDVAIRRALFQREMLASSRPGVVEPMIFKIFGGQVVVDGHKITVDAQHNSARVTLAEGDHVYLFARHDHHDGKWRLYSDDVFKVVNGAVVAQDDFRDLPKVVPVDEFVRRVYQLQPSAAIRP